jgi:hypothetical protein
MYLLDRDNIIIGNNIEALFASYVLAEHGEKSVIFEDGNIGEDFLYDGIKYLFKNDKITEMLYDLDIPYSEYMMKGGILLRDVIYNYPQILDNLSMVEIRRIQYDHFRKTRKTCPGSFGRTLMNDPGMIKTIRCTIKCDFDQLISSLVNDSCIIKHNVKKIHSKSSCIELEHCNFVKYKRLIVTEPLWNMKEKSDFYIPVAMAMSLNLVHVIPFSSSNFSKWDYVYTTYTPGDAIYRISSTSIGCVVEANGDWEDIKYNVLSDLAFLFPEGFHIEKQTTKLNGYPLDSQEKIEWPDNVFPLGKFAQWNSSLSLSNTLLQMYKYAKEWGLKI